MGGTGWDWMVFGTCPPPVTLRHQDLQSEPSHSRLKKIQSQAVGGRSRVQIADATEDQSEEASQPSHEGRKWRANLKKELRNAMEVTC